ncbi:MAG: outer membrane beta-barrel protein [Niabella sp.]
MKKLLLLILLISFVIPSMAQDTPKPDTLEIGGVTIIRDNGPDAYAVPHKKGFLKKLGSSTHPKSIKTQWGIIDLGFSNYVDNTNYTDPASGAQDYAPGSNEAWMELKPLKSCNVNIWFVTQQVNLISHYVNFQYGIGLELNNYWYKQPVRYTAQTAAEQNAPVITLDETADRVYRKNKLAADYVTVPVMLNFNLTPYRLYPFEISAGMSAGYLYAARNKVVTSDEGKTKTKGDFDLRPWKLSYIAELNLGVIRLYGSYAFKSMYQRGLDITPYNFGIRIKPVEILGKIEMK